MKHFIKKRCFILQIKDSNAKVPAEKSKYRSTNKCNVISRILQKMLNHGKELTLSQSD